MKKLLLIVFMLPLLKTALAQEEIVKWTFPTGQLADTVQNGINPLNAGQAIRAEGTSQVAMKNGATTFAAQATGWDNGASEKNWNIRFLTTGYDHVTISSKQQAGGTNGGPKNFKLQYKIGSSGTWADIEGGTILLANDWATGVVNNLALPAGCQNQSELVFIRWIMTTNSNVGTGDVTPAGVSKIDDIVVTGMAVTAVDEGLKTSMLTTFPNPSASAFRVTVPVNTAALEIYNCIGKLVYRQAPAQQIINVEKALPAGMYFVKAIGHAHEVNMVKHIVK